MPAKHADQQQPSPAFLVGPGDPRRGDPDPAALVGHFDPYDPARGLHHAGDLLAVGVPYRVGEEFGHHQARVVPQLRAERPTPSDGPYPPAGVRDGRTERGQPEHVTPAGVADTVAALAPEGVR